MKHFSKTLARIAALLMAVIMIVTVFAACAGKKDTPAATETPSEAPTEEPTEVPTEEPTEAPTEEPTEAPAQTGDNENEKLVGNWETVINIAEQMNEQIAQDETGMFTDVTFSDAFIKLELTFNADGSYTLEPEEESYKTAMTQVMNEMLPAIKDFMIAMLSSFSEDGHELTEEEMFEMLEISSWDELGEQMLGEIDEGLEDSIVKGMFEFKENKLSMSEEENAPIDENSIVVTVSVSENELTFESVENAIDEGFVTEETLPMVFNRIG